jgi:hypothetical protein
VTLSKNPPTAAAMPPPIWAFSTSRAAIPATLDPGRRLCWR